MTARILEFRLVRVLPALVALAVAALAGTPTARAGGYHSPGYAGRTDFKDVKPTPLKSISLGTGKYPNLLVDRAGTAHIVYTRDGGGSAADTLAYCNLQRGIKRCASAGTAPNPDPPGPEAGGIFAGNTPDLNHDFDGPVPLDIGNQLAVVQRRFPAQFPVPGGGTSDSNVFEWTSVDGGATLTGPGLIGDNQMAGGAIAYGDPAAPSIGTISRTQTGETDFQGTDAGRYTSAKAVLGTGDEAYDGGLALDGTRPVAVLADNSGTVIVREQSGQGDPNDAATWSRATFRGYSPRIVGGASGVFVMYSASRINGGKLRLKRVVGGQPSGSARTLGRSKSEPAISEDASGRIAFAYTDKDGVQVRSSSDGANFGAPQFVAAIPEGQSIDRLVAAQTTDGGGFVSFVRNAKGAEGVGQVVVAAFGTQVATHEPGLGPLPGGGIGSAAGDQLTSSTCGDVKFGAVDAQIAPKGAGCYAHDPDNPNLSVTTGEVNINGLRIIPDPGVRIGIDPRRHTIDTTGKVRVKLTSGDVDITFWHDSIHAQIPTALVGDDLFDLGDEGNGDPIVEGFPVDGDVDVKLTKDHGIDVPISLSLPKAFGGITGGATLHASLDHGLELSSLEFKVGNADIGAIALKDVDVSYTREGEVWKGTATLEVPSGGGAMSAKLEIAFDEGKFKSGSLDVGLPYPGIPLDDTDPPPQLYLSHGGLGLDLEPLTLAGTIGFGVTPFKPPDSGGREDYVFRLEGELSAAFGRPVTITVKAEGFLYNVSLANAKLVYTIPNQVALTGTAGFRLGPIRFTGELSAIVDPAHSTYGGEIDSSVYLIAPDPFGDVKLPVGPAIAINNRGFGVYVPPPGVTFPFAPFTFFGTITYDWNDTVPVLHPYQKVTDRYKEGIPSAAGASARRAHAAATSTFTVPAGAPTASVVVHGAGGAPQVALVGPDGKPVPLDAKSGAGEHALAISDATGELTSVGILHPRAGRWQVTQAAGSSVPITGVQYSIGQADPKVKATLAGKGAKRTLPYRVTAPRSVAVTFAEKGKRLLHVVGRARGKRGTIRFRAASLPAGHRRLVAMITDNGLPLQTRTLASYVVPRPAKPGRAKTLRVKAGRHRFTFSFKPPARAVQTLIKIVATDGRHLQRRVPAKTRRGSLRAIGFRDGMTISVVGIATDGRRGKVAKASARQKSTVKPKKKKKKR